MAHRRKDCVDAFREHPGRDRVLFFQRLASVQQLIELPSRRLSAPGASLLLQPTHCGHEHRQRFSHHLLLIVTSTDDESTATTTARWIERTDLPVVVAEVKVIVHVLRARVHLHHELLPNHGEPSNASEPTAVLARQLASDQLGERIERRLVLILVHDSFLFVVGVLRGQQTRWKNVVLAADPRVADDLAAATNYDIAYHLPELVLPSVLDSQFFSDALRARALPVL